ncbi:RNA-binding protein 28 isoform X2 [Acipenser ruthenus]|uniref:RNA-binding protein 28 isoform X2 n=1 Tax=Acipenser ruthenus TaxID=7906 RepID=UPI002741036B|nr:RNA-binding protein 28 isoform X2 [Acipenser ruthenus]
MSSTLFIRNLPTTASSDRLVEIFSEVGPVKHGFVVKEKGSETCRGFGYVTFSMLEDTQKALKVVKDYNGQKITLTVAKKKQHDKKKGEPQKSAPKEQTPKTMKKSKRKARLIIRNLSFKCSEDDLKQEFSKYGAVLEVQIPLKEDGKMRGFAFIQFKNVLEAGKALSAMNLKEIKGRQVAVDWAIPKDKFVTTQTSSTSGQKKENKDSDSNNESDGEEEEEVKKPVDTPSNKKIKAEKKPAQLASEGKAEDSGNDPESSKGAIASDEEESDEEAGGAGSDQEEESDLSELGSEDDDEDDDDDDDDDKGKGKKTAKNKKAPPEDVNEGKTVFIRNLSFDTEEDGLEEVLLKFGELKYVRIVLHPDTEHSKGCAFAQFKTKEATEKCIAEAQNESENGGLKVDGRTLNVVLAVSRVDAMKLKDKKVLKPTGTRNLYLAREGFIRAGTKAAEELNAADLAKRTRFEELKRQKLKDVNIFVSKTRLCVHNIPKSMDNKQLRTLCLKAAGGGKGVRINECRVMCDRSSQTGKALGRSLGYAFVEFTEHEHALKALRHLNNNPNIFGPEKRPIVEFSLEDKRMLKIKEMRALKNQKKVKHTVGLEGDKKVPNIADKNKKPRQDNGNSGERRLEAFTHTGVDKEGKSWSGFVTKPGVEVEELPSGKKRKKVLPLPSHRGPKIRKRDKGKPQLPQPTKAKNHPSRKERVQQMLPVKQAPKKKRTFRNKEDDRFDSLVEQYKKKILGNPKSSIVKKKSKWFS